jgi:Domain of unknown function (DUF4190)
MTVPPGDPRPEDRPDEPGGSSVPPPPGYGAEPPSYGPPPPAYGSQPPAYGSQPPAYGSQPPAYGQYGGVDPEAAYGQAPKTSTKAIIGLVMSVIGIFICPILFSIAGIALGIIARNEIDRSGGRITGRGLATAALVIGVVGLVLGVLVVGYSLTQLD